ncbi:MAG: hypothetical protein JSV27_11035 [Candidatus Bathyarchaeota archaeon]|nr:MAG: hypothetical protein JSV27_11035 [Candidatus Bathyarchaeota archaeon]
MREKDFRDYYRDRGFSDEDADSAVEAVVEFEGRLKEKGASLESVSIDGVKEHISLLISEERNSMDKLLGLARYFYLMKRNDVYIYFTSILGGRTVLPSISERLAQIAGEEKRDAVFEGVKAPPLGSPPEEFPKATGLLMERLVSGLDRDTYRRVLAGNHHRIPDAAFDRNREWYHEAESLEEYLKRVHEEAVVELEQYLEEGKVWYEQEITPEVVEYVRGNQEVLSGVRDGDRIYMTKFPYAPGEYLRETDPWMKRYYMCHCPLARASILTGDPEISGEWCYCSAGFGKAKFDAVFGVETEVEVLKTVLDGDLTCRFAVKIPEGVTK